MADSNELLFQWEASYKKGLLSFWMLLSLSERPMYAYEMKEHIEVFSQGSISADENSIYRALRRFAKTGLITAQMQPSEVGPDRKYFELTHKGCELLVSFIERNVLVLQSKPVTTTINRFLKSARPKERK
ncbi:MAG: PadR family transcriptional regulator [Chloroflexi bacterium]|nr:MAG: PadR family transcriptional regulator [Chloroflexota bacterium]MBL1195201.1 PadR family transcriptional regulator [Chloroflexota bacterium]NOH12486.1 helix-turn-helix transcriptional regulator [Chloroflexota bacterium]